VRLEVEIWPTCMVFGKATASGSTSSRATLGKVSVTHYRPDYNTGVNTFTAGGDKASYLLLPVVPEA